MQPLLSSKEIRGVDTYATETLGIPELVLMEHAALSVVHSLKTRFGGALPNTRGVIFAGPGNNGGDALAVARLLWTKGCDNILIILPVERTKLSLSCRLQFDVCGKLGIPLSRSLDKDLLHSCEWILDGMFGTGLSRNLEKPYLSFVKAINQSHSRAWIVAIDIPSGLCSDTGNPLGEAVRANETVTLGFVKKGLVTGNAAEYVGKLRLEDLSIPRNVPFMADSFLYQEEDAKRFPERKPSGHKGNYGHVVVWAGQKEHEGAALLSALGASRMGAGLVTVLGEEKSIASIKERLPLEIMTASFSGNFRSLPPSSVLVMGPGMGTDKSRVNILKEALQSSSGLVLDADALTLIAEHKKEFLSFLLLRREPTVFTPHPKEAARLLGTTVETIQANRFETIGNLVKQYGGTFILKGKGTVIYSKSTPIVVINSGDAGLSKGGTGDLLTGLVGSLIAQKLNAESAAYLGTFLHGKASERLSQIFGHTYSSTASEIADQVPWVIKDLLNR